MTVIISRTPEQEELELEGLIKRVEWMGNANPGLAATRLSKILYFSEAERLALLIMAFKEVCTEVEELRRELETERAGKSSSKVSRPSVEKRPSLSSRIGLEKTPPIVKAPEPGVKPAVAEPDPTFCDVVGQGRFVAGDRVRFVDDEMQTDPGVIRGFTRGRNGILALLQFDARPKEPLHAMPAASLRRLIVNLNPRYSAQFKKAAGK